MTYQPAEQKGSSSTAPASPKERQSAQAATPLAEIAGSLVQPGKGILAADESFGTIEKRFQSLQIPATEETRRAYRQTLFTTPGLGDHVSGVILFDETLRQKTAHGIALPDLLVEQRIMPGIKVDKGTTKIPGSSKEKITEGLDGLRKRLEEYRSLGAKFTKWRAVILIDGGELPTELCLRDNANCLARFAALTQEAGLVPIVEPEVLMDGSHTIERCEQVTLSALHAVFDELFRHKVRLDEMLLKPNMVLPGKGSPQKASPNEIAEATLRCLRRAVPPAVPGIVFLSGGQSEIEATKNLNALNQHRELPWHLSFSFGRALQDSAMKTWGGHAENIPHAHRVLLHRTWCNHKAQLGEYEDSMEQRRN
jgi:fructose-bisphosphate aldolase class I